MRLREGAKGLRGRSRIISMGAVLICVAAAAVISFTVQMSQSRFLPRIFFADLSDQELSTKPQGWENRPDQLKAVKGPNLRGVDLRFASAYRLFAPNTDFSGANLEGAEFIGADLRGAQFFGALLSGVSFVDADLRGASFVPLTSIAVNFERADLRASRIDLSYPEPFGHMLNFKDANLQGTLVQVPMEHNLENLSTHLTGSWRLSFQP